LAFVHVPVFADHDPTTDSVAMAFTLPSLSFTDPTSLDFATADWGIIPATYDVSEKHWVADARCLVGPGGSITLSVGNYRIWVRITDAPEIPIIPTDSLEIF
jgi:hypothetical protein